MNANVQDGQVLSTLTKIFRSELDDDGLQLRLSDSNETVPNWDSLAHVRIVAAIESEFDFQFDVSEIEDATTVDRLIAVIQKHLQNS